MDLSQQQSLTPRERRFALAEGGLSAFWAALEGGAFLAGFALALNANNVHQGFLAALPFLAGIAQLLAAYLIDVFGVSRRRLSVWALLASRLCWLSTVPLAWMLLPDQPGLMLATFLFLVTLGYLFQGLATVAWLGWMGDMVPDGSRGEFFSARNFIAGCVTIVGTVIGAVLIRLPAYFGWEMWTGYLLLFTLAGWSGIAGAWMLGKIRREPEAAPAVSSRVFSASVARPLAEPGFRRFLVFHLVWMSSVYVAAPFFQFFFLEDAGLGVGYVALTNGVAVLAGLASVQLWGRFVDRYGSKPVLYVCFSLTATIPLFYVLMNPRNVYWAALAVQAFSGVAWAGGTLAASTLLLKLSPRQRNATHLSVFGALSGIATAAAPILAGVVLESAREWEFTLGGLRVYHYKIIFLASFVLRWLSLGLLFRVPEQGEHKAGEVLRELGTWRTLWSVTGLELVRFHFITPLRRKYSGRRPPPEVIG